MKGRAKLSSHGYSHCTLPEGVHAVKSAIMGLAGWMSKAASTPPRDVCSRDAVDRHAPQSLLVLVLPRHPPERAEQRRELGDMTL